MSHPDSISASLADLYDKGYKSGYEAGKKDGVEAGLRRASEICQLYAADQRHHSLCSRGAFKCKSAILAEIGK